MIDFETKRQKVLAYIKGLKTMPVVVTKGPAPEPVAIIDGVAYFHKQEFDLEEPEFDYGKDLLSGEVTSDAVSYMGFNKNTHIDNTWYISLRLNTRLQSPASFDIAGEYNGVPLSIVYTSRSFIVVDTREEVTDNTKICLPTCSAYYGFLSEDGKTFISYYNLKDDGAPTETIMVPVYDQNGVDPEKIEALKAVAAGGKVGEELLDEIVDFIDNPPEPPVPPLPDDKIHAYLTVTNDSLTATFDCGTLIDGATAKVDWGDGTVENLTANTRMSHTYEAAGEYEVKISGMAAFKTGYYPGGTVFFTEHLHEVVLSNLITEIAGYAFANCTKLTSVTIGSGVTSFGSNPFYGCTDIASVTVDPNNQALYSENNCLIQTTDNVLILGCKTSEIPNGVTSIGVSAFQGCSGLVSIDIPDSVTSIGDYAFQGCSGLTSITIPYSVTSIGNNAFLGCTDLTSITIPNSVTRIGDYAFSGCTGLISATIGSSVTGHGVFDGCTNLITVTMSSDVTSIGDAAFYECSGLTSITIPYSVTSIGNNAFNGCTGLLSMVIGTGVTSIGDAAFNGCSSLAEVTFKEGRESVPTLSDTLAFVGLPANYKIYVQRDLLSAWKAAENWSNIADHIEGLPWTDGHIHGVFTTTSDGQIVVFTAGALIENVEHKVDWGDGSVENVIAAEGSSLQHAYASAGAYDFVIKGTSTIPNSAFVNNAYLTSIDIPDNITSIGNNAFNNCTLLTSITIPNSVTSIGNHVFSGCTGLTSVTIGSGVTNIDNGTFTGCSSLTSITIPDGVTSIGEAAFQSCTGLTSITVPNSVTSIGTYAFYACSALVEVTFEDGRESVPTLAAANAFNNNASGRKFYVQADLLDTWKAATNWVTYAADIEALPAA